MAGKVALAIAVVQMHTWQKEIEDAGGQMEGREQGGLRRKDEAVSLAEEGGTRGVVCCLRGEMLGKACFAWVLVKS